MWQRSKFGSSLMGGEGRGRKIHGCGRTSKIQPLSKRGREIENSNFFLTQHPNIQKDPSSNHKNYSFPASLRRNASQRTQQIIFPSQSKPPCGTHILRNTSVRKNGKAEVRMTLTLDTQICLHVYSSHEYMQTHPIVKLINQGENVSQRSFTSWALLYFSLFFLRIVAIRYSTALINLKG